MRQSVSFPLFHGKDGSLQEALFSVCHFFESKQLWKHVHHPTGRKLEVGWKGSEREWRCWKLFLKVTSRDTEEYVSSGPSTALHLKMCYLNSHGVLCNFFWLICFLEAVTSLDYSKTLCRTGAITITALIRHLNIFNSGRRYGRGDASKYKQWSW